MGARRERLLRPRPHIGARTMRRIEGSIRQRSSGSRELSIDVGGDPLGRLRQHGASGEPANSHSAVRPRRSYGVEAQAPLATDMNFPPTKRFVITMTGVLYVTLLFTLGALVGILINALRFIACCVVEDYREQLPLMPTWDPRAPVHFDSISVKNLHDGSDLRLLNSDYNFDGKKLHVFGHIIQITKRKVTLGVYPHGNDIGPRAFVRIELHDLSPKELSSLRKHEVVSAICTVGNHFDGKVIMKNCKLEGDTQ